jgi:acetate kinase
MSSVDAKRHLQVRALNCGSSSLKFGLYRVRSSEPERLIAGEAESIGEATGAFHAEDAQGRSLLRESAPPPNQQAAIARIARLLDDTQIPAPQTIGHRIVHGGPKLRGHCVIDESVLKELDAAAAFAPLHMPIALSVIRFCQLHFPGLPQVACFDTSFHAHMPDIARVLPLPRALRAEGIQRYGFHGLVTAKLGRRLYEVRVGFKWFSAGLLDGSLGFGAGTDRCGPLTRTGSSPRCCPRRSQRAWVVTRARCISIWRTNSAIQ